jgi:hypothetical protein
MSDVSARLKPKFVKRGDLQHEGPRRVRTAVPATALVETKYSEAPEFCLMLEDRTMVSLRSRANLEQMIRLFGRDDDHWGDRELELYFDPEVPNPNGAPGGIRFRLPQSVPPEKPFVSDLEDDANQDAPPF